MITKLQNSFLFAALIDTFRFLWIAIGPTLTVLLNATKRRVRDEFNKRPGFAWITKGREIENYIPTPMLEKAVKGLHQKVRKLANSNQFARALEYKKLTGRSVYTADKIKVAHEVVKEAADLRILDLKKMIDKTVSFIRQANDI